MNILINSGIFIIFVLLVPEQANDTHLNALAKLASLFSDPDFCNKLRAATNINELYQTVISRD